MKSFADRVVLITGGTSGIGRAAAAAFAREGASVVVAGRRDAEGAAVASEVNALGGRGFFIRCDVAKEAEVADLIRGAVARFGRIDAAFNNAGVEDASAPFHEQTLDNYEQVMGVNVKGLWLSMQHELRQMLKQGRGAIVNTSSVAGLIGFPNNATYTASKHAVIGLTRAAALEYGKQGIRVNAVAPAAIETDMIRRFAADPQTRAYIEGMHPIGRIGRAEEVAAAVLWLCSDAASFITGAVLPVDGAFTAI